MDKLLSASSPSLSEVNCPSEGNVDWWETRLTTGGVPGQVHIRKIEILEGSLELNCEALSVSVSERLTKILKKIRICIRTVYLHTCWP